MSVIDVQVFNAKISLEKPEAARRGAHSISSSLRRQAGNLLGLHFADAGKMLASLACDGVIVVVTRGAGRVASRYRYALAPRSSNAHRMFQFGGPRDI